MVSQCVKWFPRMANCFLPWKIFSNRGKRFPLRNQPYVSGPNFGPRFFCIVLPVLGSASRVCVWRLPAALRRPQKKPENPGACSSCVSIFPLKNQQQIILLCKSLALPGTHAAPPSLQTEIWIALLRFRVQTHFLNKTPNSLSGHLLNTPPLLANLTRF